MNKDSGISAIELLKKMYILESRNIGKMEKFHFQDRRRNIYIALEQVKDMEFFWSDHEIERFDEMWKEDTPIVEMAKELRRSEIAVFLLSFDRIFRGKVKARDWKFW